MALCELKLGIDTGERMRKLENMCARKLRGVCLQSECWETSKWKKKKKRKKQRKASMFHVQDNALSTRAW